MSAENEIKTLKQRIDRLEENLGNLATNHNEMVTRFNKLKWLKEEEGKIKAAVYQELVSNFEKLIQKAISSALDNLGIAPEKKPNKTPCV